VTGVKKPISKITIWEVFVRKLNVGQAFSLTTICGITINVDLVHLVARTATVLGIALSVIETINLEKCIRANLDVRQESYIVQGQGYVKAA